jgi:hypothetical protein
MKQTLAVLAALTTLAVMPPLSAEAGNPAQELVIRGHATAGDG